jgi:hypothetical protein
MTFPKMNAESQALSLEKGYVTAEETTPRKRSRRNRSPDELNRCLKIAKLESEAASVVAFQLVRVDNF